ncbi:MAG: hypothetical protein Kow0026_04840 [Oricola sp.]
MEYELDMDPRHLVEWLKADMRSGGAGRFEISATRTFVEEPGLAGDGASAEDESATMTAVGELEVRPKLDSSGKWVVRIRVEDVVGPHLPEEGSVPDEPEELSLEGFETDFILPDRGTVFATLETATDEDRDLFARFAEDLGTDRHAT